MTGPRIPHPDRPTLPRVQAFTVVITLAAMVCAGLGVAWVGAVGTTRYVDDDTCPAAGTGTLGDPYCRIQDAICVAAPGDTVSVAQGTYAESLRMRPGVSVVSQSGAATTTINGAGQPCTDNNYCTKKPGNQCSVVIFGSGHTTATRLEGFTLTGGAGVIQTSPAQIAGGGIFVFSSATIVNNVITNNVLSGPQRQYNGGGVYVALGAPVISNNTISGNRAVPPAGSSGQVTYGYGGGIWVGFSSDPVVTNNVITGNRAGDPNVAYSLGAGGGVVAWPGTTGHPGPVIDRNLIADNYADSLGGGLSLNSLLGTVAPTAVTNNVIVGNVAKNGGGVYTYFNKSSSINNTISDNRAFLGGGIYSGQSDTTLPVNITNNVIEGNRLEQFGNGGGLYTLDLSVSFSPTICYNLFWTNDKNHVAGDTTEATVMSTCGNFVADPRFVDKPGRDFHPDPNSPAIDRATTQGAPPVDKDGFPRGVDGDGTPNSPVTGDNDIGAYERQAGCTPTAEVCDDLDNDCNGLTDDGLGSTTCGTGQCQRTVENCVGGTPQTCTPGAPAAEVCDGLDNDCNGQTDDGLGSTTCGVGACQNTVQNCAGGTPQTCTPGAPSAEVCDGVDNNCNGAIDDGFPDTDLDGTLDCFDPDDDNDTVLDASDCAPLDATAFGAPTEVANLDITGVTPSAVTYDVQNIGSGTEYEIISGLVGRLLALGTFEEDFCVSAHSTGGYWEDSRSAPPAGDSWFYMIRSENACGAGTLGSALADLFRPSAVCQIDVLDLDADGSPSDLDCNDANALQSPLLAEVCDSIDNDCDSLTDEALGSTTCGVGACQVTVQNCVGGSSQTCTPGAPSAEVCDGADNNCNGSTDEALGSTTCGVGACQVTVQNCVGGSSQTCTPGTPAAEVCDGLDNNCNTLIDDGFPDTDADTMADCVDPDDDNDGTADLSDCAPLDATAFGAPAEVENVDVLADAPTSISWTEQTIGSGTQYVLASGAITGTPGIDFSSGVCLGSSATSPATDGRIDPSPNTAWYYLVKARNSCGAGTYGTPARDTLPACP